MKASLGQVPQFGIIGAGAAGGAAAVHLLRLGYRVTVIEAKAFPRAKVCGEYISPAATDALEAVLSREELSDAGARRVGTLALDVGGHSTEWTTRTPGWGLSRRSLDDLLLNKARALGAEVLQPERVRGVEYLANGVEIALMSGDALPVDAVVHADGSGRHDPAGPVPVDPRVVGHKCHFRVRDEVRGVRIRAGSGAYVGTIAVEGGIGTCALVATKSHIAAAGGDADAMMRGLWPEWDASGREGDWLSCGVARSRYITPGARRSVRLGNAAGAVDPVGGEGIGNALWSAMAFSELLGGAADFSVERLQFVKAGLRRAYRRRLRWRLPACRLGAAVVMRSGLLKMAWPVIGGRAGWPLIGRPWCRLTGKPV